MAGNPFVVVINLYQGFAVLQFYPLCAVEAIIKMEVVLPLRVFRETQQTTSMICPR
jgi:hypothetical protein